MVTNMNSQHPIFDYPALFNRLAGNQVLIKKLSFQFISSIRIHIDNIYEAINSNDLDTTKSIAHTLVGSASSIGCMQLSHIAAKIELKSAENNMRFINNELFELEECYELTKKSLHQKLL